MKITLDPYMHRAMSLPEICRLAADLGYGFLEISPRDDFFPWFSMPSATPATMRAFKEAMRETGVGLASLLPLYRWASPDEGERTAAVSHWKRAIEICVEMDCRTMNSEFQRGPSPEISGFCCGPSTAAQSEPAFRRTLEELMPIFEREGITLHLEPHPDDFIENGNQAVDWVRGFGSPNLKYLYCAPHTFHMGGDMAAMIRYAAPVLAHVHVADTFNHKASSGNRYILNPPGTPARVHQHLDVGQGEIDWDVFFGTLREVGFDGIMTSCVFAWEERAVDSSRVMRQKIDHYLTKYPPR
jgi:myo-inositol catabolism protein IolH